MILRRSFGNRKKGQQKPNPTSNVGQTLAMTYDLLRFVETLNHYAWIPVIFFSLLQIVAALDKSYIVWQEVVDRDIKVLPDTVVNIWKAGWKNEMAKVTSKGLRAILSSCWYLNRIHFGIDWSPVLFAFILA